MKPDDVVFCCTCAGVVVVVTHLAGWEMAEIFMMSLISAFSYFCIFFLS